MANGQQGAATMAAADEASAQQPAAPQKSGPKPGSAKAAAPKEKRLAGIEYEVSITHCLLGTKRVVVDPKFFEDALGAKAEAIRLYKGNAIRAHEHQADVKLIGPVYEEVG